MPMMLVITMSKLPIMRLFQIFDMANATTVLAGIDDARDDNQNENRLKEITISDIHSCEHYDGRGRHLCADA